MIQLEDICKQYTNHNHTVRAVDNVSFSVAPNERVGIAGGSGSGKSTLLRMIAMLENLHLAPCDSLVRKSILFKIIQKYIALCR